MNSQNIKLKKTLVQKPIEIYTSFIPHLSNHMPTPNQMHKQNQLTRKTYKSKNLNEVSFIEI